MTKTYLVMPVQCSTCPFRTGGWEHVRPLLENRALTEATPICHSTGRKALVKNKRPAMLCRGARAFQLDLFHKLGVIAAPTEEAWQEQCEQMGIRSIAETSA